MVKGQFVKCVTTDSHSLTAGGQYEVLAGEGDEDFACGGAVWGDGFIIRNDAGLTCYCVMPECLRGTWEVVQ